MSLVLHLLLATSAMASLATASEAGSQSLELEYAALYASTSASDRAGLESLRQLHSHLDEDADGSIEPSETGDFLREDLHLDISESSDKADRRQRHLHDKDPEITIIDLWNSWYHSEVYNWTSDQVVEWLVHNVELPQYKSNFEQIGVNGSMLPVLATGNVGFVAKMLGVFNPIHRSKLSLKAMDIVLFGPPKESNSHIKELILTFLLAVAVAGLIYTYNVNQRAQTQLRRMASDMEALTRAELELQDLHQQIKDGNNNLEPEPRSAADMDVSTTPEEMETLKQELSILRLELLRTEVELEDREYAAPSKLRHLLQVTYELESRSFNEKRKGAELQMELAKDACERLKRRRSNIVGAFVSTHSRAIDDVDRAILEAKTALRQVKHDLEERARRWKQIELLCKCDIVRNEGYEALKSRRLQYQGMNDDLKQSRPTDKMDTDNRLVIVDKTFSESNNQVQMTPKLLTPDSVEESMNSALNNNYSGKEEVNESDEIVSKSSSSSSLVLNKSVSHNLFRPSVWPTMSSSMSESKLFSVASQDSLNSTASTKSKRANNKIKSLLKFGRMKPK